MTLSSALTVTVIVGVLLTSLKAGDLVLRPHQQQWLLAKLEDATLWLDYRRPIAWYRSLLSPIVLELAALVATFATYTVVFSWARISVPTLLDSQQFGGIVALVLFFPMIRYAHRLSTIMLAMMAGKKDEYHGRTYGPGLFLVRSTEAIATLLAGFVVAVVLAYCIQLFPLIGLQQITFGIYPELLALAVISAFPFAMEVIAIAIVFALVSSLIALIGVAHVALIFVRGLCWRIIEYNKGAWAAIVVIVTVILGIWQLSLPSEEYPSKNPVSHGETGPS
jgi:hypothetical protein